MRAIRLFGLALGMLVWAAGNNLGFAQGNLPPVRTLGFGDVKSVVFSPDGRYLAVGTRGGGSVQLIDTSSWQVIRTFEGHTDGATSVAFSPDGRLLASGSYDETIRLWEVATGSPVRTLRGHTDPVLSMAFSPDGKLLASGSWDGTIKLWNVAGKSAPSKATLGVFSP
jgi:WD40 repeat protein